MAMILGLKLALTALDRSAGGGVPAGYVTGAAIIAENGDVLTTESGDVLITE